MFKLGAGDRLRRIAPAYLISATPLPSYSLISQGFANGNSLGPLHNLLYRLHYTDGEVGLTKQKKQSKNCTVRWTGALNKNLV